MTPTPEEIGARMDALKAWDLLTPYNFALRPKGTAFPYFCTVMKGDGKPVKMRVLLLEGWQTLHDFVRTRLDHYFGFYSSPAEMPHLELVILADGGSRLFRHDPCYVPQLANAAQRDLAARLLWQVYGVMLRLESDHKLPLKFVAEKRVFARRETAPEEWTDDALEIPEPRPHVEKVVLRKDDVRAAKDLPLVTDDVLNVDFRLLSDVITSEPRPRCVYALVAFDPKANERVFDVRVSANPESGLGGLWQEMPSQVVKQFVRRGKVPGEIRTCSGRVFRLLRPVGFELPFKLSLHERLEFR